MKLWLTSPSMMLTDSDLYGKPMKPEEKKRIEHHRPAFRRGGSSGALTQNYEQGFLLTFSVNIMILSSEGVGMDDVFMMTGQKKGRRSH